MAAGKRLLIILVSIVCLHLVFAEMSRNEAKFHACIQGAKLEMRACKNECHNLKEEKNQINYCLGDCQSFLLANFDKCKAANIK